MFHQMPCPSGNRFLPLVPALLVLLLACSGYEKQATGKEQDITSQLDRCPARCDRRPSLAGQKKCKRYPGPGASLP